MTTYTREGRVRPFRLLYATVLTVAAGVLFGWTGVLLVVLGLIDVEWE